MTCDSLVLVGRPSRVAVLTRIARARMWSRDGAGRDDSGRRAGGVQRNGTAATLTGTERQPRRRLYDRLRDAPTALRCRHETPSPVTRDPGGKHLHASIEDRSCGCPAHGPGPAAAGGGARRRRRRDRPRRRPSTSGSSTTGPPSGSRAPSHATSSGPPTASSMPKAKPPPPGGGNSTGASWTGGGPVVQRTGKVLFTMDGGNWVCSASAVNDGRTTHSLILTAGHCAYDEVNDAFATNWTYVPSFDTSPTFTCARRPTAAGPRRGLVVHSGYATAGGFNTQATVHDFAFAIVGDGHEGHPGSTASWSTARTSARTRSPIRRSRPAGPSTRSAIPAAGSIQGQGPDLLHRPDVQRHQQRQPDLGHRLQHDRRLVRRPVARRLHPGRRRHADLAELVRLQRASATCTAPSSTRTPRPSSTGRTRPRATRSSTSPVDDRGLPDTEAAGLPSLREQHVPQEEGKLDSAWGLTAHRVRMLICERCQYVLTFYEGNTIWDFD